jgi:hypothetical protein
MRIEFRKIERNLVPFNIKKDNLEFCGDLKKLKMGLVECKAKINGSLRTTCVRCAEDFERLIDEDLMIKISDGMVSTSEDLDIVEMDDGFVDLDMVLQSEIESYHCEYNICNNCLEDEINYEG